MADRQQPSYEKLAARVAELLAVVAEQAALIETLRAEVAKLTRSGCFDVPATNKRTRKRHPRL